MLMFAYIYVSIDLIEMIGMYVLPCFYRNIHTHHFNSTIFCLFDREYRTLPTSITVLQCVVIPRDSLEDKRVMMSQNGIPWYWEIMSLLSFIPRYMCYTFKTHPRVAAIPVLQQKELGAANHCVAVRCNTKTHCVAACCNTKGSMWCNTKTHCVAACCKTKCSMSCNTPQHSGARHVDREREIERALCVLQHKRLCVLQYMRDHDFFIPHQTTDVSHFRHSSLFAVCCNSKNSVRCNTEAVMALLSYIRRQMSCILMS